jgi:hypothetical protein
MNRYAQHRRFFMQKTKLKIAFKPQAAARLNLTAVQNFYAISYVVLSVSPQQ